MQRLVQCRHIVDIVPVKLVTCPGILSLMHDGDSVDMGSFHSRIMVIRPDDALGYDMEPRNQYLCSVVDGLKDSL